MTDWNLLYDPHYTLDVGFVVLVTLEIDSVDYADLPAMDMTRGALTDNQASVEIEDLRPGMRVRASDLAARGIDTADLDGARLSMSNRAWRIESHVPLASPSGEDSGEIGCILAELEVPT